MPVDSTPASPAESAGASPGTREPSVAIPRGATDPEELAAPEPETARDPADGILRGPERTNRRGVLGRLEDYFAPRRARDWANPTGRPDGQKSEFWAYIVALAIGVITSVLVLETMTQYPLPAGGDPGEWITSSFPYVGLPYPTWVVPGQYPPLLFPLLGLLVRAFGVVEAGRAFVAISAVLLGLSMYFLARSLVRSRSVALAVEAFVLLSPTLIQMFFWGGYPNLLGLVFLNFALGLFARFIRSGTPWLAFLFWLAVAATILTHTLVALVLLGTLALVFVFVVWQRWLPRTFYRAPVALSGFGIFVASVGGYYLVTKLAGVPHPQYLQTSAFAYVKNGLGSVYSILLSPYFPSVKASVPVAEVGSFVVAGGVLLALVALRLLAPGRLTLGLLTVLAMIGTVVGGSILGWTLSIVTDYLRFGYFLVLPVGLGLGLGVDGLLHSRRLGAGAARRTFRGSARATVGGGPVVGRLPLRPSLDRAQHWSAVGTAALAVFAIFVVLTATSVTAPSLAGDEQAYAESFHDAAFLAALHDIRNSGVQGNVFTIGGAAKWARAILDRNAYTPFIANRFTFDPSHLNIEETAYFAMVARDSVTNNLVAATIAGTNVSLNNETPDYEASFFGAFTPVATLLPQDFNVTLLNGSRTVVEPVLGAPTIVPPATNVPSMQLVYHETGFAFELAITLSPGGPSGQYTLTATADPGWSIVAIRGNLTGPAVGIGTTNIHTGASAGELVLNPTGLAGGPGSLLTFVNATPTSAFSGRPQAFNHGNVVSRQGVLVAAGPGGASSLNVSFEFTTPLAENLINDLPPYIDTPTVWANWSIRFVMLTNQSQFLSNHPSAIFWDVPYLVGEYGARVLSVEGSWTVVVLPPP